MGSAQAEQFDLSESWRSVVLAVEHHELGLKVYGFSNIVQSMLAGVVVGFAILL